MGNLAKALLLVVFISYQILLHTFIVKEQVEMWHLVLAFAPMLAVAVWVLLRLVGRAWRPLLILTLALLAYFIANGHYGRVGLLTFNGLMHASLNLFLLWFFARTLLKGREPLITQIANHINGPLEPEIAVYTRQATIAWCLFFTLQVSTSLLLYFFAPLSYWSFFINVLDLPILMLMFVAEHTYRRVRFPNHTRTSIMKVIEVYSRDFTESGRANCKQ